MLLIFTYEEAFVNEEAILKIGSRLTFKIEFSAPQKKSRNSSRKVQCDWTRLAVIVFQFGYQIIRMGELPHRCSEVQSELIIFNSGPIY